MQSKEKELNRFHTICRENGLKITPQRTELFRALLESKDHPTAEILYRKVLVKLPNISYDTVNRTLLSFAELGIIKQTVSRGSAKRFDPDVERHHHFQCVKCERIIDFTFKGYDSLQNPDILPKGVVVLDRKVVIEGICDRCRK
jgi:Fur family peroxide stress response transcriptional regulator